MKATQSVSSAAMIVLLAATVMHAGAETSPPYGDDPAIVARLKDIEPGHALMLGKFRVMPKGSVPVVFVEKTCAVP